MRARCSTIIRSNLSAEPHPFLAPRTVLLRELLDRSSPSYLTAAKSGCGVLRAIPASQHPRADSATAVPLASNRRFPAASTTSLPTNQTQAARLGSRTGVPDCARATASAR